MKRFTNLLLLCALALLPFGSVHAGAGQTAASFLEIPMGARAAAMGGAFTAVAEGSIAAAWNPSALASTERGEFSISHYLWLQDISVNHAAGGFRLSDRFGIGLSMTYLNYGTIENVDQNGSLLGELTAYDWSGGLSLGYQLTDQVAIGLTGKYVTQKLDQYQADAFAADVGLTVSLSRFTIAATANNFGSGLTFDQYKEELPRSIRLGVSGAPFQNNLVSSVEYEQKIDGLSQLRSGIEYGFQERYFLRAGLQYLTESTVADAGLDYSFGAGFVLSDFFLDYAYSPSDQLTSEDIHRFSLGFRFGK